LLTVGGRTSRAVLPRLPVKVRNFPLHLAGPAFRGN
jgi:hypothetical protein